MNPMFDKLKKIEDRYEFLTAEISRPDIIADNSVWKKLVKEHSGLQDVVNVYREWKRADDNLTMSIAALETEKDKEMSQLLHEEIGVLKTQKEELEQRLKVLLLPVDPNDEKNVIVEIRAGAGGDEAALFAAQIKRMYYMFAEKQRFKIEELDSNEMELGGLKEASFIVVGAGAYSKFKFESGVHRVQRVPETESQGRIHTSTITVAVLPEAEDVEIEINEKDLKIDTYRSGGAGGQHVNKTESAIRITHIPTGIVVQCQDERSQHKNKDKAMKVLKSRIYEHFLKEKESAEASARRSMVGSGDRSERIRTYNFPQGRVTDHRINMTLYRLESFLDGDMDEMIDALILAERTAQLTGEAE